MADDNRCSSNPSAGMSAEHGPRAARCRATRVAPSPAGYAQRHPINADQRNARLAAEIPKSFWGEMAGLPRGSRQSPRCDSVGQLIANPECQPSRVVAVKRKVETMTYLFLPVVTAALASISPASALISAPVPDLPSIARAAAVPGPAAQRRGIPHRHRGTPHPHRYQYYGTPYPYPGFYPEYREYGSPPSTAAPMERVPQIAPLAPRIGP
jgi:hypothetical protein